MGAERRTWFVARCIEPGWEQTRVVHYADYHDRLPISDDGVIWGAPPTEWMPLAAWNRRTQDQTDDTR